MTKFKLVAAAVVLSTVIAVPATAEQMHYRTHVFHDRGPIGAAADVAGAAMGTAGAIATAPFRNSYAYDRDYNPDGFACHRGKWFKGEDGRRHICQ
jgi:hypothetical protein